MTDITHKDRCVLVWDCLFPGLHTDARCGFNPMCFTLVRLQNDNTASKHSASSFNSVIPPCRGLIQGCPVSFSADESLCYDIFSVSTLFLLFHTVKTPPFDRFHASPYLTNYSVPSTAGYCRSLKALSHQAQFFVQNICTEIYKSWLLWMPSQPCGTFMGGDEYLDGWYQ